MTVTVGDLIAAEWPHIAGRDYALPGPPAVGCGSGRHGAFCRWFGDGGDHAWPIRVDGLRLWCPCACHTDRPTTQPALF